MSDEEQARQPDPARTIVLGLLAAPGLARELADQVAEELPGVLSERFPEVQWRVQVAEEPLAAASEALAVDLVAVCRRRLLAEGRDLVVCLTDLPLLVRRRPVTARASATHGVGLVSVPALGALNPERRVGETVVRVVDGLLGERLGSHRRRGPRARMGGRLDELSDPSAQAGRDDRGTVRFVLIVAHRLWERIPSPRARDRVVLFNLATTLTIVIGVLTLFVALLAITTACALALIARDVLSSAREAAPFGDRDEGGELRQLHSNPSPNAITVFTVLC